jgi:hypothetical protein
MTVIKEGIYVPESLLDADASLFFRAIACSRGIFGLPRSGIESINRLVDGLRSESFPSADCAETTSISGMDLRGAGGSEWIGVRISIDEGTEGTCSN